MTYSMDLRSVITNSPMVGEKTSLRDHSTRREGITAVFIYTNGIYFLTK